VLRINVWPVGDCLFGAPSNSAPGARAPLAPPKGRPCFWHPYHLHVPIVLKSGTLNILVPYGPVHAGIGIALPVFEHQIQPPYSLTLERGGCELPVSRCSCFTHTRISTLHADFIWQAVRRCGLGETVKWKLAAILDTEDHDSCKRHYTSTIDLQYYAVRYEDLCHNIHVKIQTYSQYSGLHTTQILWRCPFLFAKAVHRSIPDAAFVLKGKLGPGNGNFTKFRCIYTVTWPAMYE
jgi:hypothetical protein